MTLNGTAILGLDDSGVDMTAATQNLTVNCPAQLTAPSTWSVAPGRAATCNGIISGYASQETTDLGLTDAWSEVPAGPSYTNNPTTISDILSPGNPVKNFARLKVTQAP